MTMAQDARDFRSLTDAQYADVVNGRLSTQEAIAQVRQKREEKAEEIATEAIEWSTAHVSGKGIRYQYDDLRAMVRRAALAGLEAAR